MNGVPGGARIAIVSPPIQISGGMKEKLLLAQALIRHGLNVDIVTPDAAGFEAFSFKGPWKTPSQAMNNPPYDVAVVTWFETFDLARSISSRIFHFCQGFEGDLVHLSESFPRIRQIYSAPLPTLVVSPHLALRLKQEFGRNCEVMPPLLDSRFRPRWGRVRPNREPTIVVHGIYEATVKRVAPALRAIELLRAERPIRLVRISSFPKSQAETSGGAKDRYFTQLNPADVAKMTAGADLTLFTSEAGEGFGLPVLESLAAGVPVVAVRIPSLAVFEQMGVITVVEEPDPKLLAAAARRLLEPENWRRSRRRGLAFAALWRADQDRRASSSFMRLMD